MKKILVIAIAVLSLCSCSTITKTANVARGVNGNVLINPITANIDLDNTVPVEGRATSTYLGIIRLKLHDEFVEVAGQPEFFGLLDSPDNKVKNSAMYDALIKTDCDIILHPIFTSSIKTHLFGLIRIYDTQVKGYGAKIKDLKQVQPGEPDYDILIGEPAPQKVIIKK